MVFTSQPPLQAEIGVSYTYTVTARLEDDGGGGGDDDDGDDGDVAITFFAQTLPGWLTFDGVATITGTPAADDVGEHDVTIRASAPGEVAFQSFAINVPPPPVVNSPPVFEGAPTHSVDEGEPVNLDVSPYFSDPDGDALRFEGRGLPSWLTLSGSRVTGTAPAGGATESFVIIAFDPEGASVEGTLQITVNVTNDPPRVETPITPDPQRAFVGERYELNAGGSFVDPDGDALSFSATGLPASIGIQASSGLIAGTPTESDVGTHSIRVTATDGTASASETFALIIETRNRAPVLDSTIAPDPQSVTSGDAYRFDAGTFFSDPDGDTLSFSATGLPGGLSIDAATGVIAGTPTAVGSHSIRVTASDGTESASDAFTLNVEAANRPPVLDGAIAPDPQTATSGNAYRFDAGAFFSDPDGDALSFTATGLPGSLSIEAATGVISGTPSDADGGPHTIGVTASDGTASVSDQYSLTVVVVDDPPVLPDPPPQLTTAEDTPLTVTPALLDARDEEPGALTVVLTAPAGAANFTIGGAGNVVVPNQDFNGTLTVQASVKDASSTSNVVTVTVTVTPVNDAPRFTPVPQQSATEGAPFELRLGDFVSDPENDPITFSATGLPAGLSIDAASGTIAGVPTVGAAAGAHTVRVTASDAVASSSTDVALRVMTAGRADLGVSAGVTPNPALAGSPATFTFTVTNTSSVAVGNASLAVTFTASSPFFVDAVSDPACVTTRASGTVTVQCPLVSLAANDTRSIAATARAEQAAEIRAAAAVSITDAVPIDEMPDNDAAAVTLIVARSLGAGAAQELAVPGVRALAIGDFDGDGVADLAAAVGTGQPLLLFMNRPSGNGERVALDAAPIPIGDPLDAVDIAAADIDADGDIDLVAADSGGAHRLLSNDGSASFTTTALTGGAESEAVEIADVDGDGQADLAFAGRGAAANVVFRNSGGGLFLPVGAVLIGPAADVIASDVLAGGSLELVFARETGNAQMVSVAGSAAQPLELSTGAASSLGTGDFDGNGLPDLVLGRNVPGQEQPDAVFLNTSGSTPSYFLAAELSRAPTVAVLTGDFDGDGRTDVVAINAAGGHRLYKNSSAANLAFVLHPEQFSTSSAVGAAAGHLNGDGRLDVAVAGSDTIAVFLNDGSGNLGRGDEAAPTLSLVGAPSLTITVGESYTDAGATASDAVDGDLSDRIVVANPVDVNVIGTYTVSYNVTDLSGNAAPTLTRTVEVRARDAGGGGGGGSVGVVCLWLLCMTLGACRLRGRTTAISDAPAASDRRA